MNDIFENNQHNEYQKVACLFHLLFFANYLIPFSGIIALIIIRACRENFSEFLTFHWREALNFQISTFIYFIIFSILCVVLIGVPLLIGLFFAVIIIPIIASLKALDGQKYKYPCIFRFI